MKLDVKNIQYTFGRSKDACQNTITTLLVSTKITELKKSRKGPLLRIGSVFRHLLDVTSDKESKL